MDENAPLLGTLKEQYPRVKWEALGSTPHTAGKLGPLITIRVYDYRPGGFCIQMIDEWGTSYDSIAYRLDVMESTLEKAFESFFDEFPSWIAQQKKHHRDAAAAFLSLERQETSSSTLLDPLE